MTIVLRRFDDERRRPSYCARTLNVTMWTAALVPACF
jgi:hypothetical protein